MKSKLQTKIKRTFKQVALCGLLGLGSLSAFAQQGTNLGSVRSFKDLLANNAKSTARLQSANNLKFSTLSESLEAKILNVISKSGSESYAGKILNHGWADFQVEFVNGKAKGFVILFDEKKAYEFTTNDVGNVVLIEKSFDKTISVDNFNKVQSNKIVIANSSIGTPGTTGTGEQIPLLQSNPSASTVVYLDFDGEVVTNPYWNNGTTINAAKSESSAAGIQLIFQMIAEDYAPFNVNITTDRAIFDATPAGRRQLVIFTPTNTASPGAGGVAYINGFSFTQDLPCWVFNYGASSDVYAEAGSHEIGHTFGLGHDGRNLPDGTHEEYYGGHSNWGPIVGVAYGRLVSQFSKGEYEFASNTEDDLTIISSAVNAFGFKNDDHSNSTSSATVLTVANNTFSKEGLISTPTDKDYFKFTSSGVTATINVTSKYSTTSNLNVLAQILNTDNQVVFESNLSNSLSAEFNNISLPAGDYYLVIDGIGEGDANTGYTDYGSLGAYVVSGTLTPVNNSVCNEPVYVATIGYTSGQSVQYNGFKYTANWWTKDAQPDLNNGAAGSGKPWTQTGTCNVVVNKAPAITFTAPAKNSVFNIGTDVKLVTDAVDADGSILKVEFLNASNTVIATDFTAPYEFILSGLAEGSYIYQARAYDNKNAISNIATNNFTIVNPTPVITISAPTEGQTLNLISGQKVNISVSTNPTTVDSVKYVIVDVVCNGPGCTTIRRFVSTTAPYSMSYDPIAGSVNSQVNAIAFKNGYAAQATVNYYTNVISKPVVTITSPTQNSVNYQYPSDGNLTTINLGFNVATSAIDSVRFTVVETTCNGPGCTNVRKASVKTAPFSYAYLPTLKYTGYTEVQVVAFSKGIASDVTTSVFYVKPLPEVSFVTPVDQSTIARSVTTIPVDVNVNTANLAIDSVLYIVTDAVINGQYGTTSERRFKVTSPYDFSLPVLTGKTYTRITALAFGDGGKNSKAVSTQVNYNDAPVVTITAPTVGSKFNVGGSVTVSANVTDDGNVSKVEIYSPHIANSTVTLTAAPYTATFSNLLSSGNRYLTTFIVKATDNQGAVTVQTIDVAENKLPAITVTSPVAVNGVNPKYLVGGAITVSANVTDQDGTISKVEISRGSTNTGLVTLTAAPFTTTYTNLPAPQPDGSYSFTVKAYDNDGGVSTQLIIVYKNKVPTTTITTPVTNATYNTGANIVIGALPYDPDFTSGKIEYFNGTTKLGEVIVNGLLSGSSYNYTWANVANGTYTITAKTTDDLGESGVSSAITVVVKAPSTCSAPVYNDAIAYNGGQSVQYNGIKYTANWWTKGAQPDINSGVAGSGKPWTSNGTCISRVGDNVVLTSASSIYPNPTSGSFIIETETEASAIILNAFGKEVATLGLVKGQNEVNLSLSSGVYFVKINNNVTKLVIE